MSSLFPDIPFAKAFPEVKSLRIDYEHTETRIEPHGVRKGVITELSANKTLPCNWYRCKNGGFAIQHQILSQLISKREPKGEGLLFCCGHEYLDKRNQPACPNHLRYTVVIEYHEA